MVYKVIVQASALADAREYAAWIISQGSAAAASTWLSRLEECVQAFAQMPKKFSVIPERDDFEFELRQVLHHSHRVIFFVNEETRAVHVLRIYHGARKELTSSDVELNEES